MSLIDDLGIPDIWAAINQLKISVNQALGRPMPDMTTGWVPDSVPWVYVSATQFKIVGKDVRKRFPVGTRLWLNQSGDKYFYAIAAAMSGSDTLVTVIGDSAVPLVSGAISNPMYSYEANPQGFPFWFNCNVAVNQNGVDVSKTINIAYFGIREGEVSYHFNLTLTGSGAAGSYITVSLPVYSGPGFFGWDGMGIGGYADASTTIQYTCIVAAVGNTSAVIQSVLFVPTNQANSANKIIGIDPTFVAGAGDNVWGHIHYRI